MCTSGSQHNRARRATHYRTARCCVLPSIRGLLVAVGGASQIERQTVKPRAGHPATPARTVNKDVRGTYFVPTTSWGGYTCLPQADGISIRSDAQPTNGPRMGDDMPFANQA